MTTASGNSWDPLAFLTGSWGTDRRLLDRSSVTEGSFVGTTAFIPDSGGLLWEEQGTVVWPHFQGPASRSYRVTAETPGTMTIRFPDLRVLCTLDLQDGSATDEHLCAPDTYRVALTIVTPTRVEYSWDVTGPAKDFLLTTVLTRR